VFSDWGKPGDDLVRKALILVVLGCAVHAFHARDGLMASEPPPSDSQSLSRPAPPTASADKALIIEVIRKHASLLGVDPDLVHAVVRHESGFKPGAVSPKGAMGLMQLMPGTALLMGVNDPFDMEQNIIGGIRYLRHCLLRFGGDTAKALAAYNAGPQNVEKYAGCPPFAETRDYVDRVLRAYTGQPPPEPAGPGRIPSPSRRLSPEALAVLRELHPYRRISREETVGGLAGRRAPGLRSRLSPGAAAVLRELCPYRGSEGRSGRRPSGAVKAPVSAACTSLPPA
jgi:hypothetical protein